MQGARETCKGANLGGICAQNQGAGAADSAAQLAVLGNVGDIKKGFQVVAVKAFFQAQLKLQQGRVLDIIDYCMLWRLGVAWALACMGSATLIITKNSLPIACTTLPIGALFTYRELL